MLVVLVVLVVCCDISVACNGVSLNQQELKGSQQLKRYWCRTGVTRFLCRFSGAYRGRFELTIGFFAHFNRAPEKGGSIFGLNAKCFDAAFGGLTIVLHRAGSLAVCPQSPLLTEILTWAALSLLGGWGRTDRLPCAIPTEHTRTSTIPKSLYAKRHFSGSALGPKYFGKA